MLFFFLDCTPLLSQNWKFCLRNCLEAELLENRSYSPFSSPPCKKLFSKNSFWKVVSRNLFPIADIKVIYSSRISAFLGMPALCKVLQGWWSDGGMTQEKYRQEEGGSGWDLRLCLTRDSSCQVEFNLIIQGAPEREEQSPENNFSHHSKKGVYKSRGHVNQS